MTEEMEKNLDNDHGDDGTIGTIFVEIAGTSHYPDRASRGEAVGLVREPENAHDRNAVRVENLTGRQLGHVPRRVAAWLAPLMDHQKVKPIGLVSEVGSAGHGDSPGKAEDYLAVDLLLLPAGRDILETDDHPADETAARHQAVLAVWRGMKPWTDPVAARAAGRMLISLSDKTRASETRMLLALIRSRGRALEQVFRERRVTEIRQSLQGVTIGEPIKHAGMTMYPLFQPEGSTAVDYLLLQDALAGNLAEVKEVSASGSVPELRVINRSPHPVLIPEGELLVGAKQDRAVNVSLLIEPNSERVIGVSCVEQGRWRHTSSTFSARRYCTPSLRARKTASVSAQRGATGWAKSDQGQVWDDVSRYVRDSGAQSATGSLSHAFDAAEKKLASYRQALELPKGAAGVLLAAGGKILGLDLYDSPATMKTIWPRLSEGYFLEGVLRAEKREAADAKGTGAAETTEGTSKPAAATFLKELAQHLQVAPGGSGPGLELEVIGDGFSGSGLWYDGRVCHLGGFREESITRPSVGHDWIL